MRLAPASRPVGGGSASPQFGVRRAAPGRARPRRLVPAARASGARAEAVSCGAPTLARVDLLVAPAAGKHGDALSIGARRPACFRLPGERWIRRAPTIAALLAENCIKTAPRGRRAFRNSAGEPVGRTRPAGRPCGQQRAWRPAGARKRPACWQMASEAAAWSCLWEASIVRPERLTLISSCASGAASSRMSPGRPMTGRSGRSSPKAAPLGR